MASGNYPNKVELWDNVESENELLEKDSKERWIKNMNVNILPLNLSGSTSTTEAGTIPAETTHRVKCRKKSLNPKRTMFFIYQGVRYYFLYFQPNFKTNDEWEIMCKAKME